MIKLNTTFSLVIMLTLTLPYLVAFLMSSIPRSQAMIFSRACPSSRFRCNNHDPWNIIERYQNHNVLNRLDVLLRNEFERQLHRVHEFLRLYNIEEDELNLKLTLEVPGVKLLISKSNCRKMGRSF